MALGLSPSSSTVGCPVIGASCRPPDAGRAGGRRVPRIVAAFLITFMFALAACGNSSDDSSMSCSSFLSASTDQQLDAISTSANELGFDQSTFGGPDRAREGVVRACEADDSQRVGGVIGGFVSGLAD